MHTIQELKIRTPALLTLLTLLAHGSPAAAQGITDSLGLDDDELKGNYGPRHFLGVSVTHSRRTNFDEIDEADTETLPGNTYGLLIEGGALPFRTIFGAEGGLEASLGLGFPSFGTFFGGFRGSLGLSVVPIPLGAIRIGISAGGAFGGHRRFYLKPHASLDLGGFAELQASYTWNPPKASRVWSEGGPPGSYGIKEETLRGQLWIVLDPDEYDDEFSVEAFHLFLEHTTISTPTPEILEQKHIREGSYFSGGAGLSF